MEPLMGGLYLSVIPHESQHV
jgi:hypothetical protein